MRAWFVGLFCALLGGYAAWKGATEGAWLFACGGGALLLASLVHIARPGRKSIGLIEVCWGALIIGHAIRSGQGISFDSARSSGSSAAMVVAGTLIIVGIINLTRANRPPAKLECWSRDLGMLQSNKAMQADERRSGAHGSAPKPLGGSSLRRRVR